jgi:glycosyltransferase involved in cell wall biosynthesis
MLIGSAAFAPTKGISGTARNQATTLPRISVAMCVYNGERYLPAQLDSLLAQEDVAIEVVVVDDASTDGSLDVLRHYALRDPRIRVHANPRNLGHLRSFEKSMALCSYELIAPCDQDDVWHPRKLARLADAIENADMAYCDSAYIDPEGRPLGRRISDDLGQMHAGRDPLKYCFQNTVSGHALLVRRSVLDAALPFPAMLYHDWWLAIRAAAGRGVVYVDEPLVQFRRHCDAYSPLGKKQAARCAILSASKNRAWLEQLLYVFGKLAETRWPAHEQAREWIDALKEAADERPARLRRLVWRHRASVPPWDGPRWLAAFRCYARCKRKIRRARGEPALTVPLFR